MFMIISCVGLGGGLLFGFLGPVDAVLFLLCHSHKLHILDTILGYISLDTYLRGFLLHTYNNFTNYQTNPDISDISFKDYANNIFPTTQEIIDMVAPRATDKLNFYE